MKKAFTFIVVLLAILVLAYGCKLLLDENPNFFKELVSQGQEKIDQVQEYVKPDVSGPYKVIYVYDGDTILVDIDGAETKIRFIGVDTPESVSTDKSKNTPEGKIASKFTKSLLDGKSVYLEYDVQKTDNYDRTLAYVYLDEGKTMVQELLLKAGMATTMTIPPNSKYSISFYSAQIDARENKAGFWETGFFAN